MNSGSGNDVYIGLGCGFFALLVAALIIGVPLRDLVIWAVVFAGATYLIGTFWKRRKNRP